MRNYCTQNAGDCDTCGLVSYGRDCRNNPVAVVTDGYCQCDRPIMYCETHLPNYWARREAQAMAVTPNDPQEVRDFFGEENETNG